MHPAHMLFVAQGEQTRVRSLGCSEVDRFASLALPSALRMLSALRAELPTALPRSRVTGADRAPPAARSAFAAARPQPARRHATSYSRFGQRQLPGSAGSAGAFGRWQRLSPRVKALSVVGGGGTAFYVANLRPVRWPGLSDPSSRVLLRPGPLCSRAARLTRKIPETGRYRFIISSEAMCALLGLHC